jgi:hypothetical protein
MVATARLPALATSRPGAEEEGIGRRLARERDRNHDAPNQA